MIYILQVVQDMFLDLDLRRQPVVRGMIHLLVCTYMYLL